MARKGYAGTTMADVAKAAGLSSGIVNFHFETKEKLLVDTLRALAEEYRANWHAALDRGRADSPPTASRRCSAADFNRDLHPAQARRLVRLLGAKRKAGRPISNIAAQR